MMIKKLFDTTKKKIAWLLIGGTAMAAPLIIQQPGPYVYTSLVWERPTTDQEWADDTKKGGLDTKFDFQLQEMKVSHENKLAKNKVRYDQAILYPDSIRWELLQSGVSQQEIGETLSKQINLIILEYERVQQALERINKEIELRNDGKVDRSGTLVKIKPTTDRERSELDRVRRVR